MPSKFDLRCDGSGIETAARQFAVISWRDDGGISRKHRNAEHRRRNTETSNIQHPTSNIER